MSLAPLERHPGRVIAAIGLAFAVAYVSALSLFPRSHGRILDGDTIQYYAYLRSMAIDGDLDFTNDYTLLYGVPEGGDNIWLTSRTPVGRPTNLMSIGPALLWTPFFLVACLAVGLSRVFGIVVPFDGIAPPFPLSAGVAGVVYAALGAYFCYRACALLFPARPAFWAALAAWLGTPAVYYSVISPAYSHATSLFACALFCYVWLKNRGNNGLGRYAVLGALGGLAALVRWQDGVVLVLPIFEIGQSIVGRRLSIPQAFVRCAAMAAAMFVLLMPQFLAWHAIYGQLFLMPQGQGFMQWTRPAILAVLFSLRHGLFSWTPVVFVATAGLVVLGRRDWALAGCALFIIGLAVYVNASVIDWWAGEAFGARRFVGYTVFFAIGLGAVFSAEVWSRRPYLLGWTAAAAIAYNLLFLLQYQLFMRGFRDLAPYPETLRQVFLDRLLIPWTLLRHLVG